MFNTLKWKHIHSHTHTVIFTTIRLKMSLLSCHLPHCVLHLTVAQLMIVQLSEEWKEHLDSTDGMNSTVDGVSQCCFHVLWKTLNQWQHFNECKKQSSQQSWTGIRHAVGVWIEFNYWPAAWGRVASVQRWRHFPSVRTPGKAEHQWLWHYRLRQWSWPACHHITPACDAQLNRCRSPT